MKKTHKKVIFPLTVLIEMTFGDRTHQKTLTHEITRKAFTINSPLAIGELPNYFNALKTACMHDILKRISANKP